MKIKFDYTPYPSVDHIGKSILIWRPMVDIALYGPRDFRNVKALIDTGADDCLIHIELAEKLGVNFMGRKKIIGIGAESVIDYGEIELFVKHFDKKIKMVAGFTELPFSCLLGQSGFFDNYRVRFEKDIRRFEIADMNL